MKIQLFKNGKGLIYGKEPKRIGCDQEGVLKIGTAEVMIPADKTVTLPVLFHGSTGKYAATFIDKKGCVYDLGKVELHGGLITAPSQTAMEIMELRCRAEMAEAKLEAMAKKIEELESMYDTDALKFLIR